MVIFHSLYSHSFQSNPPWIAQFFHHEMLRQGSWDLDSTAGALWLGSGQTSMDEMDIIWWCKLIYIYTKIWNAWHASNMIPLLIYIIDDMYNNIHTHNIYIWIYIHFSFSPQLVNVYIGRFSSSCQHLRGTAVALVSDAAPVGFPG